MSTRERILIWAVALVVGVFVLDRLVVTPLQSRLSRLQADAELVEQRIDEGRVLIDNRELIEARWSGRVESGLGRDAAAARLDVQDELTGYAESSGLTLTNLSAGGDIKNGGFTEVRFSLTASGDLRSVAEFMRQVQEASVPLALMSCDISRRDESGRGLTLRLTVSTLVYVGGGGSP